MSQRVVCNQLARLGTPAATAQEMAEAFTEDLLGAAKTGLSKKSRRRRALEWNMTAEARAALADALDKRRAARYSFKTSPNPATWKILKATCKGVKTAIATGIYNHLERFVTELDVLCQDRDVRGEYRHLNRSKASAD